MSTQEVRTRVLFVALLLFVASGTVRGQYLIDDFEDGSIVDGDPVPWIVQNGHFRVDADGDLVVFNEERTGAFATVDGHVFTDRSAVRALVTFRDLDPNPTEANVFVGLNLGPGFTGYLGELWWNGLLAIGRTRDGRCCPDLASVRLEEFDPSKDWWLELEFDGGELSLRLWRDGADRPAGPQVTAVDEAPFMSGGVGLGFRRLPADGTSKGVFRQWEASADPLPPLSECPKGRDDFEDRDLLPWTVHGGRFEFDADGDLVVFNEERTGAFATVDGHVFTDRSAVRALVTFRDLDPNPTEANVFVGLNLGPGFTGYLGELWWNGLLAIGRTRDGRCCPDLASVRLEEFDPSKDWWLELEYDDGALSLRAWERCGPRPGEHQVVAVDPDPFSSGVVGLGFRRLPPGGTSKGIVREFEFAGCSLPAPRLSDGCQVASTFRRADSNDDGEVNLADGIYILDWLFRGGPAPGCVATANVNGDEAVDISDPVYLLSFLFLGGPAPAAPWPECGASDLETEECVTSTCP